MFGKKTRKHALKPLRHIGIVAIITIGVVVAHLFGALTPETRIPDLITWILEKAMTTSSLYISLGIAALLALVHRRLNNAYHLRPGIRKTFFYALAFCTGKFYTWSGLLLGMWVISRFTPLTSGKYDDKMIAYGFTSLIVGFALWVVARSLAFKGLRKIDNGKIQPSTNN
jgi:uncharacterized membrane protein YuzA (DUF378 family)